jgi:ATP dependent DNA ligase domain
MMVRLVEALPAGRWLYELKYGGHQALAFKAGKQVTLLSRNRTIFNDDSRQLIDGLKLLRSKNFVIDGEIAALDPLEVLLPAPSMVSGPYPQGDRSWRPIPAIHASLVRNRPAIGYQTEGRQNVHSCIRYFRLSFSMPRVGKGCFHQTRSA